MASRRQSPVEDLMELTSKLPWWVGVILALTSYVVLHQYASQEPVATHPSDISAAAQNALVRTFATIGQFLLPAIFGFGALMSLVKGLKRRKLYNDVSNKKKGVDDLSWREFEQLMYEYFKHSGYVVSDTGEGADGGIDLVLKKNGVTSFVQCKHWKVYKVGVKPVRELLGVMASRGVTNGVFVTSGRYTKEAIKFAKENKIDLIDGNGLAKIWRKSPISDSDSNSGVDVGISIDPPPEHAGQSSGRNRTARRGIAAAAIAVAIVVGYVNFSDREDKSQLAIRDGKQSEQLTGKKQSRAQQDFNEPSDPTIRRELGKVYKFKDKQGNTGYSNLGVPQDRNSHSDDSKPVANAIPIEIKNNKIYIPVTLGNRGTKFRTSLLLNRNSNKTILPMSTANFIKADNINVTGTTIVEGEVIQGETRKVSYFNVGSVVENDFIFLATSSETYGRRGMLGMDFIVRHPFEIDPNKKILIWQ